VYIETDFEIEPPEAEATDPTHEACPAGIFYEANIIYWSGGRLMPQDSRI